MAAQDIIYIAVAVLVCAIVLVMIHFAYDQLANKIEAVPAIAADNNTVNSFEATRAATNKFDYIVFVFFIGLFLALIVTGYFVATNPIFCMFYFLFIVAAVLVAAVANNVWVKLMSSNNLIIAGTISHFPITDALMDKFPYYVAAAGLVGLVVMFSKVSKEGGSR